MRPSRRDFLKFLLASPIAATLDVEKMLWVPTPQIVVPEITKVTIKGGIIHFTYDGDGTMYRYFKMPEGVRVREALFIPTNQLEPTTAAALKKDWRRG